MTAWTCPDTLAELRVVKPAHIAILLALTVLAFAMIGGRYGG